MYEPSGLPFGPEMVSPSWEVTNEYYTSAITHVGPPSRKIFVADGTRYVAQGGIVDIDVAPDPGFFGAFHVARRLVELLDRLRCRDVVSDLG